MDMQITQGMLGQGRIYKLLTNLMVVGIVAVISVSVVMGFLLMPSSLLFSGSQSAQTFNIRVPDRSLAFLAATGTTTGSGGGNSSGAGPSGISDSRLGGSGAVAALTAVYPNATGGFDVYSINPVTGQGVKVFSFGPTDIANAIPLNSQPYTPYLIVAPPFTSEQIQAMNFHVTVFANPDGNQCVVTTTFPDGKPAAFGFDC